MIKPGLIVGAMLLFCAISTANAAGPRTKLKAMGVPFRINNFITLASKGNLQAIRLFLEAGVNINARNRKGESALTMAAREGNRAIAWALMVKGANINQTNKFRNSPLIIASYYGHLKTVQALLERGAEVNLKNRKGDTALTFAASNGHRELVKLLLKAGAELNARNNRGQTAYLRALSAGHKETAALLSGDALVAAVRAGDQASVEKLLETGAAVNMRNRAQRTALFEAAASCEFDIAKLLLTKGADPNIAVRRFVDAPSWEPNGQITDTALSIAVRKRRKEIVTLLLKNGANPATGLIMAVEKGDMNTLNMLLGRGASLSVRNAAGQSPIQVSVLRGNTGMVRALLNMGASPKGRHSAATARPSSLANSRTRVPPGTSIQRSSVASFSS